MPPVETARELVLALAVPELPINSRVQYIFSQTHYLVLPIGEIETLGVFPCQVTEMGEPEGAALVLQRTTLLLFPSAIHRQSYAESHSINRGASN